LGGIQSCYGGNPPVTNCILWGDFPNEIGGSAVVTYSDVEGGWPGEGNIDADPLFADADKEDYHLTWNSPCRNTGDNSVFPTPFTDYEGDPRIAQGTVDMGIDEFYPHLYQVGVVGLFSTFWVKVIGNPGTSPITLAQGSGIQDPPQSTPYGDLYIVLPPVKIFNLGAIPADGILVVSTKKPPGWQLGDSHPFQALVGPLGNPASVLTNLMVLTVE
jgi:hypothetical protein